MLHCGEMTSIILFPELMWPQQVIIAQQMPLENLNKLPNNPIEIIPKKLYFCSCDQFLEVNENIYSFNIDTVLLRLLQMLEYSAFNSDFGPLKISCFYEYATQLKRIMAQKENRKSIFWHITSTSPKKYINAVFLICAFQIIVLKKSCEQAYQPFQKFDFIGFLDSSPTKNKFQLQLFDCLKGIERGVKMGWFDLETFDLQKYLEYQRIQNGDINQIIKNKVYAFSLPSSENNAQHKKKRQPTDKETVELIKKLDINVVITFNQAEKFSKILQQEGVIHKGISFQDLTLPNESILSEFFSNMNSLPSDSKIGIACKTGLSKTATLICCYMISKYNFSANQSIAWMRFCRPGSVYGAQHHFLLQFDRKTNKNSIPKMTMKNVKRNLTFKSQNKVSKKEETLQSTPCERKKSVGKKLGLKTKENAYEINYKICLQNSSSISMKSPQSTDSQCPSPIKKVKGVYGLQKLKLLLQDQ